MTFPIYSKPVPYVNATQMIEVDRAMVEDYRIELIQMMENAGRNLAHLARQRFLSGDPRDNKIVILAGTGGNGGGAMVCARRLHNWGADVQVFITKAASEFSAVAAHQFDILRRMGISVDDADTLANIQRLDLIIDGVIGYSLKGAPEDTAAILIQWANKQDAPILALDAPSGIDISTGTIFDPAIRATATMTLALPKEGLRADGVQGYVGELYLADIGVPPNLYAEAALGLDVGHIFARNEIIRLS